MATPDDVANFISITGAPESVAVQKLEEYKGNINDAMNAYFLEEKKLSGKEKNVAVSPQSAACNQSEIEASKREWGECSSLEAKNDVFIDSSDRWMPKSFESPPPQSSHQEEVKKVAKFEPHAQSGLGNDEIEEEMLKAAIEASKKEWQGCSSWEEIDCNDEDSDLARAIAFSIETAEKEQAVRKIPVQEEEHGVQDLLHKRKLTNISRNQLEEFLRLSCSSAGFLFGCGYELKNNRMISSLCISALSCKSTLWQFAAVYQQSAPLFYVHPLEGNIAAVRSFCCCSTAEREKSAFEIVVEEKEEDPEIHDLVDKRKKTNTSINQLEVADDLGSPPVGEEEEFKSSAIPTLCLHKGTYSSTFEEQGLRNREALHLEWTKKTTEHSLKTMGGLLFVYADLYSLLVKLYSLK
ncbi:unnamed protein product [Sphenostylis stenocarpa]|uniref:Uncharacterized protein n=1 Tax=Sphenostylis stenocarpa TaxID=92480 RepID=A0AA86SR62_9FABA|nr:unnamed protein product [Sphenostylis stenocarpa]